VGPDARRPALGPDLRRRLRRARSLTATSGYVDLQCNGGFGIDLTTEPERVAELGSLLAPTGVVEFLPTLISCPVSTVERALATGAPAARWHLEGPFLNPQRRGAHAAPHVRPVDLALLEDWLSTGCVAMVTVAPELDGALTVIERVAASGAVASIGHTDATAAQVRAAVDAGARFVTHLGNAMSAATVDAVLAEDRLVAGVIVDGEHVAPARVARWWRTLGAPRFALVSDAMAGLGLPPGRHRLGDAWVTTDGRRATGEDGRLAGSVLGLADAVDNLVAFTGCSRVEAAAAASSTPARVLAH
jgi:N-acetylglucosamine-6-phosphate deacetylase